jgi:formylmethanofuran dehydrogenase subunit E
MKIDRDLLDMAIKFHGHKCPAMPLGLRAGLTAMEKLNVKRALNKELFCYLEVGPAHAMMCFGDGVQMATGCTYGKANIQKLNYSKTALTLIDVEKRKAVRVVVNPEFQKKGLSSQFVQLRSQGIQPQNIPSDIVDPLIQRILEESDQVLFKVSEVFDFDFKGEKSSFEWYECENCKEITFAQGIRIRDGKKLCIRCAGYGFGNK